MFFPELPNSYNEWAKRIKSKILRKKIYHFLHIGKTGGSAIKYALKDYTEGKDYTIFLHKHRFHLNDVPNGEKVIFFLRDPIKRFISGFYSRKREGRPRFNNPWSKNEKISFENFTTPNELAIALSSKDLERLRMAHFAMANIFHVKNSYLQWFKNEAYLKSRFSDILFIGFQENLDEDFEILKIKIGLPENLKLPNDDVISHRTPKEFDRSLDDEAISNLNLWYKDDFRFFDLCKQLRKTHYLIN